jgi:hypothetical protein
LDSDSPVVKFIICALLGKNPADRVKTLLGKLDSLSRTQERGSSVSRESKMLSNKFIGQVEKIFKNLPKPMEWLSFLNNDLPLLIDFCEEVQEVSIQHRPWPRPDMQGMNAKTLPTKSCNDYSVLRQCRARAGPGPDPECKWPQEALAQKLGGNKANGQFLDLRYLSAPKGRSGNHYHPIKPPWLDPGEDRGSGGFKPKQRIRNCRKYQFQ